MLGLHRCAGCSLLVVRGLLLFAVASLVWEHGLQGALGFSSFSLRAQQLWCTGLVALWPMGPTWARD